MPSVANPSRRVIEHVQPTITSAAAKAATGTAAAATAAARLQRVHKQREPATTAAAATATATLYQRPAKLGLQLRHSSQHLFVGLQLGRSRQRRYQRLPSCLLRRRLFARTRPPERAAAAVHEPVKRHVQQHGAVPDEEQPGLIGVRLRLGFGLIFSLSITSPQEGGRAVFAMLASPSWAPTWFPLIIGSFAGGGC